MHLECARKDSKNRLLDQNLYFSWELVCRSLDEKKTIRNILVLKKNYDKNIKEESLFKTRI